MERQTAESWVKVIAILHWVSAGLGLLAALVFTVISMFAGSMADEIIADSPELSALPANQAQDMIAIAGGILLIMAVVILLLSVLSIFIGFGLWRYRNWARVLTIVLSWIGAAFLLVNLIASAFGTLPDFLITLFVSIVSGAIYWLLIWFFQFEPTVKSLFVPSATPADPAVSSAARALERVARPAVARQPAARQKKGK